MIIASVADKWQYIHPKLATRKSSQFQAQNSEDGGENGSRKVARKLRGVWQETK